MNKKNEVVLILVIIFIVGIAVARPLISTQPEGDKTVAPGTASNDPAPAQVTLDNLILQNINKEKPAALVFTYEADCCPSTREFFDRHKQAVQELENKYKNYINFVWIDIAFYQVTEREALMELVKKYSVTSIPAVVLVDKDGQAKAPILGEFDVDAVDKQLQSLVSGS